MTGERLKSRQQQLAVRKTRREVREIVTPQQGVAFVKDYQSAVNAAKAVGKGRTTVNKYAEVMVRGIRRTGELIGELPRSKGGGHTAINTDVKGFLKEALITHQTALEAYARSRGLQRPMLGASRRVEARIGQLLPARQGIKLPRHAEDLNDEQLNQSGRAALSVLPQLASTAARWTQASPNSAM